MTDTDISTDPYRAGYRDGLSDAFEQMNRDPRYEGSATDTHKLPPGKLLLLAAVLALIIGTWLQISEPSAKAARKARDNG